nr:MAG TPA: hypothetical protein [Caudoviricetes sp.]
MKYSYSGPIMSFGQMIASKWDGETNAPSKQKAKINLTYQAKKACNLVAGTRITLPADVKEVV